MPRKQSDKIITHRIEFSPKERALVEEIITTQTENQRLDAVTNTLQAAGTALGGAGGLIAALGLAAWFGYSVKDEVFDKTKTWINNVTNDYVRPIILNKTNEEILADIADATGWDYQAMMDKSKDLKEQRARFCTSTSKNYDAQECQRVDAEMNIHAKEMKQMYDDLQKALIDGTAEDSVRSSIISGIWDIPSNLKEKWQSRND